MWPSLRIPSHWRPMSLLLWALVLSTACLLSIASAASCAGGLLSIASAASCAGGNKGTIHLSSSNCSDYFKAPTDYSTADDMFPLCGVAYKVASDSKNIMTLTPVFNKVYNAGQDSTPLDCRLATGRARVQDAKKRGEATLQLWRDQLKESHLRALPGASALELTAYSLGTAASDTSDWTVDACRYVYKVTSGCVLGAKAPATPAPLKCPAGSARKLGLEGIPYCEACSYSTYSTAGAAACKACPSPSHLWRLPATIRPQCSATTNAVCPEANQYGEACTNCPAESRTTPDGDSCAVCVEGKRCCAANPSPSCPACKPGAKGKALTLSLVATETKGAPWEKCQYQATSRCYGKVDVTISSTCAVTITGPAFESLTFIGDLDARPASALQQPVWQNASCSSANLEYIPDVSNSGRFHLKDVLSEVFVNEAGSPALLAGFSGPYFTARHAGSSCATKFRVTKASKPAALAPLKLSSSCPASAKECKKPCPAGSYIANVARGPTMCLPCAPGTFSTKLNSAKCKKCPAGKVTAYYGSTACSACPPGLYPESATYCLECSSLVEYVYALDAESIFCIDCPDGTASVATGCISRKGTAPCCYEGECGALPKCPQGPPPAPVAAPAVLKLASSTPSCKSYPLLACLSPAAQGGRLYLSLLGGASDDLPRDYNTIAVIGGGRRDGPLCGAQGFGLQVQEVTFSGDRSLSLFMPVNYGQGPSRFFGSAQQNSKGGLDVVMWENVDIAAAVPAKGKARKPLPVCKASFSLESGYLLGLKKAAASCPHGLALTKLGGIKVCKGCRPGEILRGGKCVGCGPGTYSREYATAACSKCPQGWVSEGSYNGTNVEFGAAICLRCSSGTVPSYAASASDGAACVECPANTYYLRAAKCKACPPGTRTQPGEEGALFCWF